MTAPAVQVSAEQRRDLRQLAGAAPFALWLRLYVDEDTTEDDELHALVVRNAGNLKLAAAELLDGLVDGAETIRKLKLEGELEVEFLPVQYATKSAGLRQQVRDAQFETPQRFGPPLAGIAVSRAEGPQLFGVGARPRPADREEW